MTAAKISANRTPAKTTRPALHASASPLATATPNLLTKVNGEDRKQIQAAQLEKQSPLQQVAQRAKQLAEVKTIDSDTALGFCNLLKSAAADIESAAWGEGQQSLLESLRVSLPALLPALCMAINTGVYTSRQLEQIAYGLGALAGESRGLFHDGQVLTVDPAPFQAACRALSGKCADGEITFASSNGSRLAILNLMSRGLKRGLLDSGDSLVRAAYAEALASINLEPGLTMEQALDDRQSGKWLVQLSTIASYNLLDAPTDPSGVDSRLQLSGAARAFLVNADAMLAQARQRKSSPNGVVIQNHIDAARNLANHGVLDITQNPDLQSMATLLKLIGTLDLDTLRANFGRTIASVTNFLLFLEQQGVSTLPEIGADFRNMSDKVLSALSCFTPTDTASIGADTVADLLQYIDMGRGHKPDDARLAGVSSLLITALGQLPQREIRQATVAASLMSRVESLRKKGIVDTNTALVSIGLAEAVCLASSRKVPDVLCAVAAMESLAASPLSETTRQSVLRNIERLLLRLPANKTLNNADKLICLRGLALLVPLSSGAQWNTVVELFVALMGKKAVDSGSLDSQLNNEIQRLQMALYPDRRADPAPVATSSPAPQASQIQANAGTAQLAPIKGKQDRKRKDATQASMAPQPGSKENQSPLAKPASAPASKPARAGASRQTPPAKARVDSPAQQRALWFELLQNGKEKDLTTKLGKLLSQQPTLLNATLDKNGVQTPMVLAVASGHKDVVAWLWKKSSEQLILGPGLIDAILTSTTIVDQSVTQALDTLLSEISIRFKVDGLAQLNGFQKKLLVGIPFLPEVLKKHGLITDLPTVVTGAKVVPARSASSIARPVAHASAAALDAALDSMRDSGRMLEIFENSLLTRGLRGKAIGWSLDETRAAVANPDPSPLMQMLVGDDGYLKQDKLDQAAAAATMAAKKNPLRLREILALQQGKELLDHTLVSGETIRHFMQDVARIQQRPEVSQAIIDADTAAGQKQASALV